MAASRRSRWEVTGVFFSVVVVEGKEEKEKRKEGRRWKREEEYAEQTVSSRMFFSVFRCFSLSFLPLISGIRSKKRTREGRKEERERESRKRVCCRQKEAPPSFSFSSPCSPFSLPLLCLFLFHSKLTMLDVVIVVLIGAQDVSVVDLGVLHGLLERQQLCLRRRERGLAASLFLALARQGVALDQGRGRGGGLF